MTNATAKALAAQDVTARAHVRAHQQRVRRALALLEACERVEVVRDDGGIEDGPRLTYDRQTGAWTAEACCAYVDMGSLVGALLALGAEVRR